MFGFFKNLLRKPQENSPGESNYASGEYEAAPDAPTSDDGGYAAAPAQIHRRPAGRNTPGQQNGRGVDLPLQNILNGLPLELQPRVRQPDVGSMTISVPLEKVLAQLSRGAVKVSFGELRQAVPEVFTTENDRDRVLVPLPLADILSQLNPALITRRRVQRQIDVPADISSPFDAETRGLVSPPPRRDTELVTAPRRPAARGPVVPPPVAPGAIPMTPLAPMPAPAAQVSPIAPAPAKPAAPPAAKAPAPAPARATGNGVPSQGTQSIPSPISFRQKLTSNPTPPAPGHLPTAQPAAHAPAPAPQAHGPQAHVSAPAPQVHAPAPRTVAPPASQPPPPVENPSKQQEPAAPVPAEKSGPEGEPLSVGLTAIADSWPDGVRKEIVALRLVDAKVLLPARAVEQSLKHGRVAFSWKMLRSWIKPPVQMPSSPNDGAVLELPLKVVAPLFLARQQENAPHHQKVSVDEDIPNLFFGFPQPESGVPVAAATARPADTNFYVWDENSDVARVDETDIKRAPSPGTKFVAKYATPNEVVSRAAGLDGVTGALIALPDGLMVANRLPAELNPDTLAAFLPQIFGKVSQCTKGLRMGDLNNLNFTVGNIPWKIFRVNSIFFAAFGKAGEPLPTAQLAALAAELDHKPK